MEYRREVDGLRALAVLPVILFHAGFETFAGGFVGVDVFFIISGYLITTIILNDLKHDRFSIVHFYERRARRILPALFVVMATCLPFAWHWLLPIDMKDFSQSLASVALFSSNFLFWARGGYFDTAAELKPLLHTWSLAVEEQFYILFPLMLAGITRFRRSWTIWLLTIIVLASLARAQWGSAHDPIAAFFLLPTRSWELATGALVACYLAQDRVQAWPQLVGQGLSLLGLACIVFSVFSFGKTTPSPSLYTLIPTLGAAFIIMFATPSTVVGKVLGHQVLVGLGLISYSAYLWHQPLFAFARHRVLDEPSALTMALLSLAALVFGVASWHFIERPFRQKNNFTRAAIFTGAALGSLTFLGIGVAGHLTHGFDARRLAPHLPENYLRQTWPTGAQARDMDGAPCTTETASLCHISAQPGRPKILLVGDSHSLDFASEYLGYAKRERLDAWQMSVAGCAFIPDHFHSRHGECRKAREVLEKAVENHGFHTILFVTNMNRHVDQLKASDLEGNMASLVALMQHMLRSGSQLVYFTPRPYFNYLPTKAAALNQLSQLHVVHDGTHDQLAARIRNLRGHGQLMIFDQSKILMDQGCSHMSCFKGHTMSLVPLYRDRSHLTTFGAQSVFAQLTLPAFHPTNDVRAPAVPRERPASAIRP